MKNKDLSVLAERLTKVRLFAGMPREEISEVLRRICGDVRRFAKGEEVVYEGTAKRNIDEPLFAAL